MNNIQMLLKTISTIDVPTDANKPSSSKRYQTHYCQFNSTRNEDTLLSNLQDNEQTFSDYHPKSKYEPMQPATKLEEAHVIMNEAD